MRGPLSLVVGLTVAPFVALAAQPTEDKFWGQWRGPQSNGVSSTAKPPTEWGESKNVRWKVELPGRGTSTPVIWGDRVYVLTAAPVGVELAASHDARSACGHALTSHDRRGRA